MAGELFELFKDVPDETVGDIILSIKDGAKSPSESLGFTEPALNSLEMMGYAYYRGRKYPEAARVLSFVLSMNPARPTTWRALGGVAQANKNFDAAMWCYTQALQFDPEDLISAMLLGESMCRHGEKKEGVIILRAAVERAEGRAALKPYIIRAKAIIAADGGVPQKTLVVGTALKVLEHASRQQHQAEPFEFDPDKEYTIEEIKRDPALKPLIKDVEKLVKDGKVTLGEVGGFTDKELNGAYKMAVQFLQMKKIKEAMQLAGYLMLIDPYKGRYYQLAGICLQRMKQYDHAVSVYKYSLALDKNEPRTLMFMGECHIMLGEIDKGVELLKKGLGAAGQNREFHDVVTRGKAILQRYGGR